MVTDEGKIRRTFQTLGRKQLEIYAREIQDHFHEELRLRKELEERNRQLEQRVREVTALNQSFQEHLRQRFEVVGAYREVLEKLHQLSEAASSLVQWAESQSLPDLEPIPDPGDCRRGRGEDKP